MNPTTPSEISRREALQWVILASGIVGHFRHSALGAENPPVTGKPYGTDPLVNRVYKPGDFWSLTLRPDQLRTVSALVDVILPADEKSPGASAVGVPSFIDEWVSAPYPEQQRDRPIILEGLQWIEADSQRRFQKGFADLSLEQKSQIADDICYLPKAKAEFRSASIFFSTFRALTLAGYYTSKEGMKDIGYIGNTPQTSWNGAPANLVKQLGLAV